MSKQLGLGGITLSSNKRAKGLRLIEKEAKRLKLECGSVKLINGRNKKELDATDVNDRCKNSSISRYEQIWKEFTKFCILFEDYQSPMLTYRELGVKCPYSPKAETVIMFARYLVHKSDNFLTHYDTGKKVKFGSEYVKCQGTYQSISSLNLIRSALSKLSHHYDDCKGQYENTCEFCVEAFKISKGKHGCLRRSGHKHSPKLFPSGNISTCESVVLQFDVLAGYISDNYTSRHTIAYFPSELRDIRSALLTKKCATDNLESLQTWTIILLATKLMLRIDEAINLTVESCSMEHSLIKNRSKVENLLWNVQGKSDAEVVHLITWTDKTCKDLCPIACLLIYLSITGISSGYIFPDPKCLKVFATTGTKKHITYSRFRKNLVAITKCIVQDKKSENLIVGTHALRKTGLLLAVWHYLSQSDSKYTASDIAEDPLVLGIVTNDARSMGVTCNTITSQMRLSNIGMTKTYLSDVASQYSQVTAVFGKDPKYKVGEHRSIYCQHLQRFASLNYHENEKSLPELAENYLFTACGMTKKKILRMTFFDLYEICFEAESGNTEHISANLSPSHRFLVEKLGMEFYEEFIKREKAESGTHVEVPVKQQHMENLIDVRGENYPERIKATNDISTQVKICMEAYEYTKKACTHGGKKMSVRGIQCKQYKNLYNYSKVSRCVEECFRGNIGRFCRTFDGVNTFTPSNFVCAAGKNINHKSKFK